MKLKGLLAFVVVTVAGALIWTATQDWYEKRRAAAVSKAVAPPAGPGPSPV